jgi:hypothetical protein
MNQEQSDKAIHIWKFNDAPPFYRSLSKLGGNEVWLMYVPSELEKEWLVEFITQDGEPFGERAIHHYPLSGATVYIGASDGEAGATSSLNES